MTAMDFRGLASRLLQHPGNAVLTFEKGQVVRRSHPQVHADVQAAVERLRAWCVRPGMRVGIRAPNCYEWLVHDLALLELRAVSVAFTDDFASADPGALCEQYHLALLLAPGEDGAFEPVASTSGTPEVSPDPDFDRPWLIFSSGSSGGVKGITLSRRGVEQNVEAFTGAVGPRPDDRALLFLPLSNFQQRQIYYSAFWHGFDVIVTDPARLFRAMKELEPTTLIAPPMFFEVFETRFGNLPRWKQMAARALGKLALALPSRSAGQRLARLVFQDAYQALGGRMRLMVTGMAPIKRSTLELFALMQLPLFETYGATECGSLAINVPGAHRLGSVGKLLPGVQVKLAPDGELIVHRQHLMALGYFQCAAGENESTFIGDNLVATGDVGRFDADGFLYLVGRKKEIIVTAGGEKVHPEAAEAEIDRCPDVAKSVVLGDGTLKNLVTVVLPKNPEDPEARRRIQRHVEGVSALRPSLSIEKVIFTDVAFSRENGLLRPNLKLDRRRISERFSAEINDSAA